MGGDGDKDMNDEGITKRKNGLRAVMEDAHGVDFGVWGLRKWTQESDASKKLA